MGSLTEYYKFSRIEATNVLSDLQLLKTKVLSQPEIDIINEEVLNAKVAS